MTRDASLDNATDGAAGGVSPEQLLEKLRRALARDGDFPASAKAVNELRTLTSDPKTTGNQVTEVILREPSLGTRILHIVNSAFYRRSKPIMTVSQAVVQIGMRPLAELCSGLILLQKFVPVARRGGVFASCLQKTILTSLLSKSISAGMAGDSGGKDEQGYLAGNFAEIGSLLLAYYFPKLFESAARRAEMKNMTLNQSIQEITGIPPIMISLEVLKALHLPDFYHEVLETAQRISEGDTTPVEPKESKKISIAYELPRRNQPNSENTAKAIYAAHEISQVVASSGNRGDLDKVVEKLKNIIAIEDEIISSSLGQLPAMFRDHCSAIELTLPALPEYVSQYETGGATAGSGGDEKDQFSNFVDEIRVAVENREPTASIITSVMETLAWSLHFDRVLLMLLSRNKKRLVGRMVLGNVASLNPQDIDRPLGSEAGRYAPDTMAFLESRPVFNGDPVLEGGWPIAVLPIGFGDRAIGVIYADRIDTDDDELSAKEQAAIGVLAELLDRSISVNSD